MDSGRVKKALFSAGFPERVKNALFSDGFLKLDYFTFFWLFIAGSIIGLGLETAYHYVVFGDFESRAGLVWGPFSPIYGVGAVLLTIFLNRFHHSHNLIVFLASMVLGSTIEYFTSWGMEYLWGAVAWDYADTLGSLHGRTNFYFAVLWGMSGLFWVRLVMPLVKKVFENTNKKDLMIHIITLTTTVVMIANILCTCLALDRQVQRREGIPANDSVQLLCDEFFPDSFLNARFENMTVKARE